MINRGLTVGKINNGRDSPIEAGALYMARFRINHMFATHRAISVYMCELCICICVFSCTYLCVFVFVQV